MDMLELVVHDAHQDEIPSWVFLGQWVLVYKEGDVAKEVKWYAILHHHWSITQLPSSLLYYMQH
jgi:hypothetical protein